MSTPDLVPIFHALGDPTRWDILSALADEDASASELAEKMPVSRQAIAKHLDMLEAVGLVTSRQEGRHRRYRALGSELSTAARKLDAIGERWQRRLESIKVIAEEL
ncbi:metalloregulator ArsR/SmtB family transcription factor [Brevibacterium sp.]|uniref:ArsR/SmtB family transcription factor n=1 Tax=Brevibacterium sp. TaxID=1701 RepID=UPI002811E4DD|nr:metalloregulator ArsR/SmtB family transcription factor [Brevibacterium sp.]